MSSTDSDGFVTVNRSKKAGKVNTSGSWRVSNEEAGGSTSPKTSTPTIERGESSDISQVMSGNDTFSFLYDLIPPNDGDTVERVTPVEEVSQEVTSVTVLK